MHFPLSFCKNASPYFVHGAFAPSFIWSRRPWGSLQRSPDPLAGFKGSTSKGREEKGREGTGREGNGLPPLSEILNTPLTRSFLF